MEITDEQLAAVQKKQLANIVAKLNSGKTLTAREEAKLAGASGGSGFARTWDELAEALSVTERALFDWRKRNAVAIKEGGRELTRADGRHAIGAWQRLADKTGLRGKGLNNGEISYIDERELRLEERRLRVEREKFELQKAQDAMLPLENFQEALRVSLSHARAVLNSIPGRASGKIVSLARARLLLMLRSRLTAKQYAKIEEVVQATPVEYADIEEVLTAEVDQVLKQFSACEFMPPPGPDIAAPA